MDQALADIKDGVLYIADGLSRRGVENRAQLAMAWANDIRGRYTSVLDLEKRARMTLQAYAWASILYFLDDTGDQVFSAEAFRRWEDGDDDGVLARIRECILSPLRLWGVIEVLRMLIGKKPWPFYEPWGAITGAADPFGAGR